MLFGASASMLCGGGGSGGGGVGNWQQLSPAFAIELV